MLTFDMFNSMSYDEVIKMIIASKNNIFYMFVKDKGCSKMVRKDIQLSSTDLLTDPVIQTTTVNHLLNDKSK